MSETATTAVTKDVTKDTPQTSVPPHSADAERAVLGAILLDSTSYDGDRVIDICQDCKIEPESFYDPKCRQIYYTMLDMKRESKSLDSLTLMEELKRINRFEAVGGAVYIQSLMDEMPTSAHAEHYIKIVKDKHLRRQMIECADAVKRNAYDEREYPDASDVLDNAERKFLELGDTGKSSVPWNVGISRNCGRLIEKIRNGSTAIEGLSTGYRCLDSIIGGMKPGQVIVIAARPSQGKTSLAMNIAESCASGKMVSDGRPTSDGGKQHPVAVFSLEMDVDSLTKRMLVGHAGLNMKKINSNLLSDREKDISIASIEKADNELGNAPIFVDDTPNIDVTSLRAKARRTKKRNHAELIVIDYLQLCACREYDRMGNYAVITKVSQQIKAMAKEVQLPVVVLSQLSRDCDKRDARNSAPKLSDLRDSGAIEQDADVVMLLQSTPPKDGGSEWETTVDVAKNRNGATEKVKLRFDREHTRFLEITTKCK